MNDRTSKTASLLAEIEAVMHGEHGSDWADHFGPLFQLVEDVRAEMRQFETTAPVAWMNEQGLVISDTHRRALNNTRSQFTIPLYRSAVEPTDRPCVHCEAPDLHKPSSTHTTEEDFQHWLSYTGGKGTLQQAYYAGANVTRPDLTGGDPECFGSAGAPRSEEEYRARVNALPPAFQSLLDLPANWDSYGAKRINLACVQKAYEIWKQLAGTWLPVPHSDGTVGLEQHQGGFDIEIDVDLSLPPEKAIACIWKSGCKHPEVCNANLRCVPGGIEGQS